MNLQDVKNIIGTSHLKSDGNEPLYKQISGSINILLDKSHDGELFTSERELSAIFKVNRRTLRKALKPFIDSGMLECTAKGTFVRKNDEADFLDIHPLSIMKFMASPNCIEKKNIKICLYQNYPLQKKYWREVTDIYNKKQSTVKLELDWLSNEISTVEDFNLYIKTSNPDLILISHAPWHTKMINEFAAEIPQDIRKQTASDNYWTESIMEECEMEKSRFVLISFALPCLAWNKSIVEKLKVKDKILKLPSGARIEDIFAGAEPALKGNLKLTGHIADIMGNIGIPARQDIDGTRNFFKENFERVTALPKHAEKWFYFPVTSPYYIFESMKLFKKQEIVFSGALLMYISNMLDKESMFEIYSPEVTDDKCLVTESSGFIVNSSSENQDYAWDFIRFMLSAEPQERIPSEIRNCSVIKECNRFLPKIIINSENSLNRIFARIKEGGSDFFSLGLDLANAREEFYPGLINRTISVNEALEKTMKKLAASAVA